MHNMLPIGELKIQAGNIGKITPTLNIPGFGRYSDLFAGALSLNIGDGSKQMTRKVKGWAEDGHRYDEL